MPIPEYDPHQIHQPSVPKDRFKHPDLGYMEYIPSTMVITGGREKLNRPVALAGVTDSRGISFVGTKQPYIPTCSEPVPGNAGCPKWAGCPFKALPYVGPVALRLKYDDDVNYGMCYDYYEKLDERGWPSSQNHMGMDGWKLALDDTTHPVLGAAPVRDEEGKIVKDEATGKAVFRASHWHREIPNLGPPWWPLIVKKLQQYAAAGKTPPKNLGLPRSAELYPELAKVEDECGDTQQSAPSRPSAYPSGRGKRTTSTSRRRRRGTASSRPSSGAESSA